ncbi:hypothetical protein TWF718_003998 [Orbilia javanica]|uniref:DUF7587 domain-containing protein n=1 Tax=Orbilia javanica TaxID=47235 RepID=A0AAN8N1T5_9PEZI
MTNYNRDAGGTFRWSQLLQPQNSHGSHLVSYNSANDYDDYVEGYDDAYNDDHNISIEDYDAYFNEYTPEYNDYDDGDDYHDDEDDDEYDDEDDDDYDNDYYDRKYHYLLSSNSGSGGKGIPILPEREPPETLYRVHYSESVTSYSHDEGFLADNQCWSRPVSLEEFHNHLNWRSRTPSRFISTFSDRRHAFAWARNWEDKHPDGWCFVMKIKPQKEDIIYHMETVIDRSGVEIPPDCPIQRTQPDEYLFFHQIPEDRIVEFFDPETRESLDLWGLVHELSTGTTLSSPVEEESVSRREISAEEFLLAMRSLSIQSADGW